MALPIVTLNEDGNGCDKFGQCASCVLETCWFDLTWAGRRDLLLSEDAVKLYDEGLSIDDIASRLDLPRRTTVRFLGSLRDRALVGRRRARSK